MRQTLALSRGDVHGIVPGRRHLPSQEYQVVLIAEHAVDLKPKGLVGADPVAQRLLEALHTAEFLRTGRFADHQGREIGMTRLPQDLRHLFDALGPLENRHPCENLASTDRIGQFDGALRIARCHSLTRRRG